MTISVPRSLVEDPTPHHVLESQGTTMQAQHVLRNQGWHAKSANEQCGISHVLRLRARCRTRADHARQTHGILVSSDARLSRDCGRTRWTMMCSMDRVAASEFCRMLHPSGEVIAGSMALGTHYHKPSRRDCNEKDESHLE